MERCQYLHHLDSNFRHYLIHLSFLWYWIQLLYASFSSVSSCFALHWILHCIQDISHFRGLVGAFCAGGGWEKIWVFVDMHQQSTSKGLVFHQFYAFFFCDLSCMLSNWFCTCTLENLCRKVHDSLLGSMHGCANVEEADLWSEKAFHSLDTQSAFQFACDGQFSCVVSKKLLPCLNYRHHIFWFINDYVCIFICCLKDFQDCWACACSRNELGWTIIHISCKKVFIFRDQIW